MVPQLPVPAPAGPGLDRHRKRLTPWHLPFRTKLLEHRIERDLDRCRNFDLFGDFEGFDGLSLARFSFHGCPFRRLRDVGDSVCSRARCSACCLMRSSWWSQSSSKILVQSCTVFSFSASSLYMR